MKIVNIDESNYMEEIKRIFKRDVESFSKIDEAVESIVSNVIKNGDRALKEYTKKFDGVKLDSLKVQTEEIDEALESVGSDFISILEEAKDNIWDYHSRQLRKSWTYNKTPGIMLGQLVTPIQRVGIYVPGGKAAYPSTVLMDSVPANVAGVKSIAMVTPPMKNGKVNPYILAASRVCGIEEIYKVGGAQSIAALAYGTETIKPVNKIVGPGNVYVARAKKRVFGTVAIDMIAGPSEICIVAEGKANSKFIAGDLLSQAEHDEMAAAILVTTSYELALEVEKELEKQMKTLSRNEIMERSINNQGVIFVVNNIEFAFKVVNEIAPEHLEIMLENPLEYVSMVENAGAIFLGQYSPEPLGDYFAGPNHTLPTSGTAKFSSPLGVDDFIKKSSLIYYENKELLAVKDKIIKFAENEGLTAHANSIKVRY
ncbi:MAG: hisD [Clostridiales bacterium]|nr:hisD [Clostridiales bacterium]